MALPGSLTPDTPARPLSCKTPVRTSPGSADGTPLPPSDAGPLSPQPPPYSSLFGEDSPSDPLKRPPHSSPATFTPALHPSTPVGQDGLRGSADPHHRPGTPASAHYTEAASLPLTNDSIIYGKMLELEDLVSSVQHTLYSQTRAYRDVTSQLSEISHTLSRLQTEPPAKATAPSELVSPPPPPPSRVTAAEPLPSSAASARQLASMLTDLDLSYPSPMAVAPTPMTPRLRRSPSDHATPVPHRPVPAASRAMLVECYSEDEAADKDEASGEDEGEPDEADATYNRINDILQSLIDNASEAINTKSGSYLDDLTIAQAEQDDEYLTTYRKQVALVSPGGESLDLAEEETADDNTAPAPTSTESTVPESTAPEDGVEVQFWCKVVKKGRVLQESLDQLRQDAGAVGGKARLPVPDEVVSEHQLHNRLVIPLMTAATPNRPFPSPFSPAIAPDAKYSAGFSPRASVGRFRTSIRKSLIGANAPVDLFSEEDGVVTTTGPKDVQSAAEYAEGRQVDHHHQSPSAKETTRSFVNMLYWTLLFTIGALLLDSFICNVAGHQVLGLIDHIHATTEADDRIEDDDFDSDADEVMAALEAERRQHGGGDGPVVTEPVSTPSSRTGSDHYYNPHRPLPESWPAEYAEGPIVEEIDD
ncbi:hypothetical protein IWQ60_001822 [Tieghemiomyces parasiticus]|uniref:Uncharacterized protein n=1 Tax=Tieghemiomyces parasiticus TaxID=78921 RepID=A0A9W8DW79_9FUNG|nr:hypothetical protein IWQ60_001822 [Tieghemiomyces parasiticus]